MNGNDLLEKMELIAPEFVEAAERESVRTRRYAWVKLSAVAACLCIVILAAVLTFLHGRQPVSDVTQTTGEGFSNSVHGELPVLDVTQSIGEGFGDVRLLCHDFSELKNANPWSSGEEISTLPVYKNNEYGSAVSKDKKKMKKLLLSAAESLGLDGNEIEITDTLSIVTDDVAIYAEGNSAVFIDFRKPLSFPKEYKTGANASYGDMMKAAEYLKVKYSDLMNFEDPQIDVYGGDYSFDNNRYYHIAFFDGGENYTQRVINYNFNRAEFGLDEDGTLICVRLHCPDLTGKVGDYPVISGDRASDLLTNGYYIGSDENGFPGSDYIHGIELVYIINPGEEYFMPYYRFSVNMPEEEYPHSLKGFAYYYVPAIESEYLTGMPVRDGTFFR